MISRQRSRDKVSRVNDILPYMASGRFYVPENGRDTQAIIAELRAFSPAMTRAHDDIVDTVADGIDELLLAGGGLSRGMDLS